VIGCDFDFDFDFDFGFDLDFDFDFGWWFGVECLPITLAERV
jgi:hypothetical protein